MIRMDRVVGVEPTTSAAMLKFYPDTGKPMTHHDDAVKVAHAVENTGTEDVSSVVVELKK
jgi:hypothetical protein